MAELCYANPPRKEDIFQDYGKCDTSCILPTAHWCAHVFKLPDGRYIQWEDDFECDCCEPEEEDRCYTYGPISEEEVAKLIKEYG